jgi:sugar lactone lactonase YvrE
LSIEVFYNKPEFVCPNTTWNDTGETFINNITHSSQPRGIFVDNEDRVYVSFVGSSQRISIWSNDGINVDRNISDNTSDSCSLFVTPNGDIYIDNAANSRIDRRTVNDTESLIEISTGNNSCFGLFVDINDTLYCSISELHKVLKRSLKYNETEWILAAGNDTKGNASDRLHRPHGIFVDNDLSLYVADCENNRIQLFKPGDPNGTTIEDKDEPLDCPAGVVLDNGRNLYVVDNRNHRIVVFEYNFNICRCLIGCGKTPGLSSDQLDSPIGMSFDREGNIYVSDTANLRIQKFFRITQSCGKYINVLSENKQLTNKVTITRSTHHFRYAAHH